ncbi:MAG: putative RNA-binding protein BRN1 [Streblomastix strix]|uniref:Putative RNA-binding protein BRN1 n=1 Tax=Streblomastix strix TaxID=222440 RepID=A0A5J4WWP6_9EUKA|nr:MAG: putative RNA-binding protein BRN1 [Streblomastix strix]
MARQDSTDMKLFVGNIPMKVNEDQLRAKFEQYGKVESAVILKDRNSNASRRCGFVIYADRRDAQQAVSELNMKSVFEGGDRNLIVRPAENNAVQNEVKLFVGSLPRNMDPAKLHRLFEPYGEVIDACILKFPTGESRGCGFVKYMSHHSAIDAIQGLNNTKVDNDTPPIQVKFADNLNDKQQKKNYFQQQSIPISVVSVPSYQMSAPLIPVNVGYVSAQPGFVQGQQIQVQPQYSSSVNANPNVNANIGIGIGSGSYNDINSQLQSLGYNQYVQQGQGQQQQYVDGFAIQNAQSIQAVALQSGQIAQGYQQQTQITAQLIQQMLQQENPQSAYSQQQQQYQQIPPQIRQQSAPVHYQPSSHQNQNQNNEPRHQQQSNATQHLGSREEGPPRSNVFIYHLPCTFTEADLTILFCRFGKIISTRVIRDKLTGNSKGYGFVSFDTPEAANDAIAEMNGYEVVSMGGAVGSGDGLQQVKRLKVQLKKE